MIPRALAHALLERVAMYPVVTLTGPRQSGKTTLCRMLFPDKPYLNLEALDVREFALSDPRGFLAEIPEGAVLDEVQQAPALFSYLQVEVDRDARPGRFILTGSENFTFSQAISQSLAGRTGILHLLPCTVEELTAFPAPSADLWTSLWRGSYPRIFDSSATPEVWYADYLATYVERDVRRLLNVKDLRSFAQFLRLAAGRTAQELNLSTLAGDVGVAVNTIKAWVSVLEASYLVALVPGWHPTIRKQVARTPKMHFLDSGLACHLLGIRNPGQLAPHPLRGAIFESWVVSEVYKARLNHGLAPDCFHYREAQGPEVDLMVRAGEDWRLVEARSARTVDTTFFQHLHGLAQRFWGKAPAELRLVYGGDAASKRSGVAVIPWRSIQGVEWG
ncbi:MAG: ATP-binding protein [Holophaga sp.]|jgi:hypothetical protein